MSIQLTTTAEAGHLHGVKVVVYGDSGVGKTRLCATAPNPLIISAEAGLLSLREYNIPVITVKTVDDLLEAYNFVTTNPQAAQFETICLDSVSEIGEVILANAKKATKDPRQAYGTLIDYATEVIRKFRDIPNKHIYFAAKMERVEDKITGISTFQPSMPGSKLGQAIPYFFDGVYHLGIGKDEEGKTFRYLRTAADIQYKAKDRSGSLAEIEVADLSYIFNKIMSAKPAAQEGVQNV